MPAMKSFVRSCTRSGVLALAQSLSRASIAIVIGLAVATLASAQERMRVPMQIPQSAVPRLQRMPTADPPVNLRVEPQNPGLHKLSWEAPGASQFRVLRRIGNAPTWTLVADGVTGTQYTDRAIVWPNATYRVETIQPRMMPGGAEIAYQNPPRPEFPVDFRGNQDVTETVTLRWKAVANITAYRLFGPTLPQGGLVLDMSKYNTQIGGYGIVHEIFQLPPGTHTFSIASVYGEAGYLSEGMPTATVIATARRGRYRITVNGFRSLQATNDDPILHRDGKGDEIFVAVFVGSDLTSARRLDRKVVRSRVYGDINRFPERILAGSSSPTGGIGPGNAVPATAGAALLPVLATPDRLPLLVWEGMLWDGDFGMAVAPSIWEWDGDDTNYQSWSGWLLGTRYDWLDVLTKELKPEPLRSYGIGPRLDADTLGIRIDDSFGKDLPIGYSNVGMISLTSSARPWFSTSAYLMNRTNIERLLGSNQTAILKTNFRGLGGVGGDYDLFLQIERLQ